MLSSKITETCSHCSSNIGKTSSTPKTPQPMGIGDVCIQFSWCNGVFMITDCICLGKLPWQPCRAVIGFLGISEVDVIKQLPGYPKRCLDGKNIQAESFRQWQHAIEKKQDPFIHFNHFLASIVVVVEILGVPTSWQWSDPVTWFIATGSCQKHSKTTSFCVLIRPTLIFWSQNIFSKIWDIIDI